MSAKSLQEPPKVVSRIVTRIKRRLGRLELGGSCYCICCKKYSHGFLPYNGGWKTAPAVIAQLDVIGSDLDNHECPKCGSTDRERHLQLYCVHSDLEKHIAGARILHFAPERHFSTFIESAKPALYIKADLYPASPGVQKMDMLKIPYDDEAFDMVIANHVLEHVADDLTALREIHRVVRKDGLAILQTPYGSALHATMEDRGVVAGSQREFLYGQSDHVRLYGCNIFEIFASVGFSSCVLQHDDVLRSIDPAVCGVNAREPLFLFKRI